MTRQELRSWLVVPRPTAWGLFVLLLVIALGTEYWEKDPPAIAGVPVPWPKFVLALMLLPFIVPAAGRRWSALTRIPSTLSPLYLFWVWCGLSIVGVAYAAPSSSIEFLKTFVHLTMYVVFVTALVKWTTWPRLFVLIRAYYALGIAAAILSILQFVHGAFGWFPWFAPFRFQSLEYALGGGVTTGFRTSSVFGEPSWAARYYVHWMTIALAFWWRTRQRSHLAALTLFVLAFYVANSVLGYIILLSFVAAIVLTQMWRHDMFTLSRRQKVAGAAIVYTVFLLWLAGSTPRMPDLIDRSLRRVELIVQDRGGGASNRIDGIFAGLAVWRTSPIIGVGFGNIDAHIVPFYRDPEWVLRSQYSSDSTFVQIMGETGLIGLAAFLWFWGRMVFFSPPGRLRGLTPEMTQGYTLMRFLQVDLVAQAAGMINYADYLNPHLWTIVAITLALETRLLHHVRATDVRRVPVTLPTRALPSPAS